MPLTTEKLARTNPPSLNNDKNGQSGWSHCFHKLDNRLQPLGEGKHLKWTLPLPRLLAMWVLSIYSAGAAPDEHGAREAGTVAGDCWDGWDSVDKGATQRRGFRNPRRSVCKSLAENELAYAESEIPWSLAEDGYWRAMDKMEILEVTQSGETELRPVRG